MAPCWHAMTSEISHHPHLRCRPVLLTALHARGPRRKHWPLSRSLERLKWTTDITGYWGSWQGNLDFVQSLYCDTNQDNQMLNWLCVIRHCILRIQKVMEWDFTERRNTISVDQKSCRSSYHSNRYTKLTFRALALCPSKWRRTLIKGCFSTPQIFDRGFITF